jgi:hypothetical protein
VGTGRGGSRAPRDRGSPCAATIATPRAGPLAPTPGRRQEGLRRPGAARSAPGGGDRLASSAWPIYFWSQRRQPLPELTAAPSRRIAHGREPAWPSPNLPLDWTARPHLPSVLPSRHRGSAARPGADLDGKATGRRRRLARDPVARAAPGRRQARPPGLDDRSQPRIRPDMSRSATRSLVPAAPTHLSRPGPPSSTGSVGA